MYITLTPVRCNASLSVDRQGDLLTINGEVYDLSGIPEGAILPRDAVECSWLASDIERKNGRLHLSLILPHGSDAPDGMRFPDAIDLEGDGPVALPFQSTEVC